MDNTIHDLYHYLDDIKNHTDRGEYPQVVSLLREAANRLDTALRKEHNVMVLESQHVDHEDMEPLLAKMEGRHNDHLDLNIRPADCSSCLRPIGAGHHCCQCWG